MNFQPPWKLCVNWVDSSASFMNVPICSVSVVDHARTDCSLSLSLFFFYKLQVFCDQELFSATFGSSVSNLSDLSPCDSCLKRLHFALRFWNQVLTCRSVNPSTLDNCFLSGGDKYFWFSNIFSNSIVCSLEKRTWPPFFFWGFGKNRFQAPKKV